MILSGGAKGFGLENGQCYSRGAQKLIQLEDGSWGLQLK